MGGAGQSLLRSLAPSDLARCSSAESFLQSAFWGSFKACFGWNARAFSLDWGELGNTALLAIRRRLLPGISFAYVPWGPELPEHFPDDDRTRSAALGDIAKALRPFFPRDTAFIRFDPPWYSEGAGTASPSLFPPLRHASADIQAPDTVLIDLIPPADEILSAMKPKWRYNIGLARRRGVSIKHLDEEGLETFYALFQETSRRDGIAIHGKEYYEKLFSHCRSYPGNGRELRLYTAEHEGSPLGAVIVLFRGRRATYLYGASSNEKRNLMAPYLLQWQAMEDAKAAGCEVYDLFGIPPSDDPAHPMAGLYRFKTGFGGRVIHRPGSWDYTYRPLSCGLFRGAEAARKKLRDMKKASKPGKQNSA
ncbi:peptidoglycan bridge formation glycyltransferase FemA/FemB family protein [Treponema sp. OttesenSCG-928-L16]|nr:peptidoglycan bridge formation glycyltransferase FemA/FemB family protein [Treponema sp. OttesenSCG-928-L16]